MTKEFWLVLAVVWVASLAWIWALLDEDWIPHDEGALAQAAERVLFGELPHADFDEVYTGGLDWLNAGAMRVFGVSLRSMRIALFLVFALWVPAVYWIATRFARPLVAAPFVVLAVACSLPFWAAPMPSWYTLFFATFGTAALLRWLETSRAAWIAAAGAAAGLGVLAKITGLHFAAAALLFLAWREPALTTGKDVGPARRAYPIALSVLLAAFVAGLVSMVRPVAAREGWAPQIVHFVFPGALLAALTAHRAWTASRAGGAARARALLRLVLPFLAGLAVPIAVFLVPYVARGALGMLVDGVVVLPTRRLQTATTIIPPQPVWVLALLAPVALLAVVPAAKGHLPKLLLLAGLGSLAAGWWAAVQLRVFFWAGALPVAAALGGLLLWKRRAESDSLAVGRAMAVLTATCLVSLVQFPFTVVFYFCYFAPLLVMCVMAVLSLAARGVAGRPGLMAGALAIAVCLIVPGRPPMTPIDNPRAGLRVAVEAADVYDRVVASVRAHARGPWIWAGPDAPEIAFLAGLRNPTRTIYDFFDRDYADDPKLRGERLLQVLDAAGVNVVAMNLSPGFSGEYPPEIIAALRTRYIHHEVVGRFIVAWRS